MTANNGEKHKYFCATKSRQLNKLVSNIKDAKEEILCAIKQTFVDFL